MSNRKAIHDRVLNATDKDELASAYSEWAAEYDRDLVDEMGYVAPAITSELLQQYLPDTRARILDAGCGTGLVGQALHQAGFHNLAGLDYSTDMLQQARAKGVYQALHQADLTATLDFPDDHFDAVVSVGTFTCGHVGPEAFRELIRVTRPGGCICFTVRDQAWEEDGYRPAMAALEKNGAWTRLEEKETDYIPREGANCMICVYRTAA
jgi:predicted TPR repeat methyltransferase